MAPPTGSGGQGSAPPVPVQSVVLRIKPFGNGSIVSKPSGIECGSGCSHSFQVGTTVVLTANAAPGEKLANWVGCDSSSGSTCTVTLNGNRLLLPTFVSTAPLQIKSSTKVLDAATIHAIVKHVGSTYYFAVGTTAASSLQSGDVIVGHGTTGNGTAIGILARVVSVTTRADGTIVVTTSPARLTDVISSGTVWYSKPLTQSQLKTATSLVAGVVVDGASGSCSSRSPTEFAVSLNHVLVGSSGKQVSLNGCLKLSFKPDFALNIGLFSGVKEFRTVLVTTSSQSLSLDTTVAVNLTKTIPIRIPIPLSFATIWVEWPIVWITPNITVYLGTEVQADGSVQLAVTFQENATGGVEYQQGSGWSSIHSFTPSFTAPSSQFKAQANATGYVEPNFSLQVDDMSGPFVAFKGYLQGVAWVGTGGTTALGWNLYGGVAGYAGMEADPLGWNLGQIQFQLFDKRILLKSSTPSASLDTAPPTVPLHLAAVPASANEIDLTWDPSTDDSAVKDYKIYKDGSDWKTVASRFAADTGLGAQTQACYSVEAVDVAGNVSGPTATVCATTPPPVDKTPPTTPTGLKASMVSDSITLSWNPSTDNVGVRGYKVSRNGAPIAAITQAPYTQYTDTLLAAGTKYCYTVEAFDASGNLSIRSANVCVTTTTTPAGNRTPLQEVTPIDGVAGDGFGASVAIDGTTAVIGAPNKTVNSRSEQGVAYVYTYQNGAWTQRTELTARDGSAYSAFGTSVIISGTTIVVGAQGELAPGEFILGQQGAVYIFKKLNGTWVQSAKLTAVDGGMGDSFGTSVALSGSTLLIGAPYKSDGDGEAYVFTNKTGVWTLSKKLIAKNVYTSDRFGTAVAVSGTTVMVGAPGVDFGTGRVFIFTEQNGVWVQIAQTVELPSTGGSSYFGTSIAFPGATALVGAPSWLAGGGAVHDYTYAEGGAVVYSFTDQNNIWAQSNQLALSATANPLERRAGAFGASVAASSTTAVIGAPNRTVNAQYGEGAAYVYTTNNGIWTRSVKLTESNGAANDNFGASVAISGTTELVGAPNTSNGGAAYFFSQ